MTAANRSPVAALRAALERRRAFPAATGGSVVVEYGLIAALVVVVIIVTLSQVRTNLLNLPLPAIIAALIEARGE